MTFVLKSILAAGLHRLVIDLCSVATTTAPIGKSNTASQVQRNRHSIYLGARPFALDVGERPFSGPLAFAGTFRGTKIS